MKRRTAWLLAILLMIPWTIAFGEATDPNQAAWTVLIYMCGSDLESEGGFATANLEEIRKTSPFPDIVPMEDTGDASVNILIQTGGCIQWRTEEKLGFAVAEDRLQRYQYVPEEEQPFLLADEAPLRRMSDAETLKDFIQWGKQRFPADHYVLVLWGHGGGSRTGLLPDECFSGEYMNLKELDSALEQGGVHFDVLVLDACMMANLETAQAVQRHTDYLVASEEIVAGSGSAYDIWLNELYASPGTDAYRLGRLICDSVQKKGADLGDEQVQTMLTFSLIDTSKVDGVTAAFDNFWKWMGEIYTQDPDWFGLTCSVIDQAERYGAAEDHMTDIGSMLRQQYSTGLMDGNVREALMKAISDAVPYMVRGAGRSEASGLSFCYGPSMSKAELDRYAENCRSATYLAWLDAVNPDWQAPAWVYEETEPLPGAEENEIYRIDYSVDSGSEKELPSLTISNPLATISGCHYVLYRYDEKNGEYQKLGENVCEIAGEDKQKAIIRMDLGATWPAIKGELCDLELVSRTGSYYLYNIPMMVLDTRYDLRVAFVTDNAINYSRRDWFLEKPELQNVRINAADRSGRYEVYGFWKGYNISSVNASRDTSSPRLLKGQEYMLLYPILMEDVPDDTYYIFGERRTMPDAITLEEIPLPEGSYAAAFQIRTIFGEQIQTDMMKMTWNGQNWHTKP